MGRLWLLIRGIFLYNTVYWRRASDGLNPPRISGKQRQELRPVRDLSLIKPREKPRAKIGDDSAENEDADEPLAEEAPPAPVPPPPASTLHSGPAIKPFKKVTPLATNAAAPAPALPTDPPARIKVKKRRVRHRTDYDGFGALKSGGGFLDRFFKKKR